MWTSFNPSTMWAPHSKKFVKDVVLHDLEVKNIANLRDSLPELLSLIRERDKREMLNALNENRKVVPMELIWHDDWDVRDIEPSAIVEAYDSPSG